VRKAQMESQRRTAREARGEPAKNGMTSAPATNAWTASQKNTPAPATNGSALLDTFSKKPASAGAERKGANGSYWQHRDLPSEEEQMRILMEEDETAWKTVEKKPRVTKRKDTAETENGGAVKPIEAESTDVNPSEAITGTANGLYTSDEDAGWTVA